MWPLPQESHLSPNLECSLSFAQRREWQLIKEAFIRTRRVEVISPDRNAFRQLNYHYKLWSKAKNLWAQLLKSWAHIEVERLTRGLKNPKRHLAKGLVPTAGLSGHWLCFVHTSDPSFLVPVRWVSLRLNTNTNTHNARITLVEYVEFSSCI